MGFLSGIMDSLTGAKKARSALEEATARAEQGGQRAVEELRHARERSLRFLEPYQEVGTKALPQLQSLVMGRMPEEDITMTPLFRLQQEEGEEAINRAAAARGGYGATATVGNLGEFNRRLLATETDKMFSRLMNLVSIGSGATTQATSALMQAGGQLASAQLGGGQSTANMMAQRASTYTDFSPLNVFSDIVGGVGSVFGLPSIGGAGGSSMAVQPLTRVGSSFNPMMLAR